MADLVCTECGTTFTGPKSKLTCSPSCKRVRKNRLQRYTRSTDLTAYPVTIPSDDSEPVDLGEEVRPDDSPIARREVAAAIRRERSADGKRPRKPGNPEDPTEGVPGESDTGFRPSLVRDVLALDDSEVVPEEGTVLGAERLSTLVELVAPSDPPGDRLHGLSDILRGLGYTATSTVPPTDGWTQPTAYDTEPGPDHEWWRSASVPRDGLRVGRTVPNVRDVVGSDAPHVDTYVKPTYKARDSRPFPLMTFIDIPERKWKPARAWPMEDIRDFGIFTGCPRTRLEPLKAFVICV
ncbi:hypothetical protein ACL02T_15315 [Pseudonocardia sp. RS010]|uniref:hypothetical protein n=1 Tax=Pseudonocardia sp. RS010 TaxID=3385979 RepID=UPI0039A1108B